MKNIRTAFVVKPSFRRIAAILLSAALLPGPAFAQESESEPFIVEDIRIDGLRRFDPGVVFSRLNVELGEEFTDEQSIEIIKTLFDTGFFRSVDVLRDGGILVVKVDENPTIAEVNFSGVDEIGDSALEGMLQGAGIVKARVFDRALVEAAVKALEDIYIERNFYKVKINPVISPLPRNRIALLFEVEEGDQAYIRSIEIEGNEEFSDWALKRSMNLEPRGLFNYFGDSYLFSESKLESDLERIRTLYLEDGYLRFEVEARQAEVSPDKEHIDIRIRVNEGQQYLLARQPDEDKDLFSGELPPEVTASDLRDLIQQVEGEVFSTQSASEAAGRMRDLMGDYGYAFAEATYENTLDDESGTVEVIYRILPGDPVYVRNINISGNERTRDEVIRREMLQFERERYSRKKVESSRRRIRRLGYFSDVVITRQPVEEDGTQTDLAVVVTEGSVGTFRIGAGFSTDNALSFEAGLNTPNIFGSGNNFSADFSAGNDDKRINLSLDEFYHTDEGISRHINMSIAERESSGESSGYNIDGFTTDYGYGIPYGDDGKYNATFAYEKTKINSVSSVYREFDEKHGRDLDVLLLRVGLTHDTRDSFQQPTDGYKVEVSSETGLPLLDLRYYRADVVYDYYYQTRRLWGKPVWHFRSGAGAGGGYAGDVYPFYERYFVGGTSTLRGFDSNSIGASRDGTATVGGRARAYGTAEAAVDIQFFKTQKVYMAPFFDFGTVGHDAADFEPIRSAVGVEIRWISPIGPLRFSWGRAVTKEDGDKTQDLQFSVRY